MVPVLSCGILIPAFPVFILRAASARAPATAGRPVIMRVHSSLFFRVTAERPDGPGPRTHADNPATNHALQSIAVFPAHPPRFANRSQTAPNTAGLFSRRHSGAQHNACPAGAVRRGFPPTALHSRHSTPDHPRLRGGHHSLIRSRILIRYAFRFTRYSSADKSSCGLGASIISLETASKEPWRWRAV
jgi:hypothetical protein